MKEKVVDWIKSVLHPGLLSLKALYFCLLGAQGCLVPYIPIFIQHLGLNASENGIIFGCLPFIAMLAKPAAGALSDKLKTPRLLLCLFSLIQLIFMFSIYFVPPLNIPKSSDSPILNVTCENSTFLFANLSTSFFNQSNGESICSINSTDLSLILNDTFGNFTSCTCSGNSFPSSDVPVSVRWTTQFWSTGILLAIAWFGYAGVGCLADAIAFKTVIASPIPTSYGANRVFGTMGWAIFALAVGFLLDQFSDTSASVDRDFTPAFVIFSVTAVLALVATFFLPKSEPAPSEKLMANLLKSFLKFEILLFCTGTFTAGVCSGLLYGYLAWYQSELGASNILLGLTVFIQCCYEAPMMAISEWIISKIGYHNCMISCLLSFGVRFLGYGLITNPWFVLMIDSVHSVGFGLFYAAMTSYAYNSAPTGGAATMQGILGSTYEGVGQGIGGIVAGFVYHQFGGRNTWLGYSGVSFGVSLLYIIGTIYLWNLRKKSVVFA